MVALAGPVAKEAGEAAAAAGARPGRGWCPPEGAWGSFPPHRLPLPLNPRRRRHPLPKNNSKTENALKKELIQHTTIFQDLVQAKTSLKRRRSL